jgi:hypothetical protein
MFGNQANFQELQRKLSTFATFGIKKKKNEFYTSSTKTRKI